MPFRTHSCNGATAGPAAGLCHSLIDMLSFSSYTIQYFWGI